MPVRPVSWGTKKMLNSNILNKKYIQSFDAFNDTPEERGLWKAMKTLKKLTQKWVGNQNSVLEISKLTFIHDWKH